MVLVMDKLQTLEPFHDLQRRCKALALGTAPSSCVYIYLILLHYRYPALNSCSQRQTRVRLISSVRDCTIWDRLNVVDKTLRISQSLPRLQLSGTLNRKGKNMSYAQFFVKDRILSHFPPFIGKFLHLCPGTHCLEAVMDTP